MKGILIVIVCTYAFFENIFAVILFLPFTKMYMNKQREHKIMERKKDFLEQFCVALEAIEVHLRAGNSIEQSFMKIMGEMELLYSEEAYIYKELEYINDCILLDVSIEDALFDMARRVNIDDIHNFCEVFAISKRSDGNIIRVINTMINYVREDMEVNRQIKNSINNVLQEVFIMKFMPLALLLYLKIFSKGYYDCVYNSILGYIAMFVIFVMYIVIICIIDKMQKKVLEKL